jgi:hypothetical protein
VIVFLSIRSRNQRTPRLPSCITDGGGNANHNFREPASELTIPYA